MPPSTRLHRLSSATHPDTESHGSCQQETNEPNAGVAQCASGDGHDAHYTVEGDGTLTDMHGPAEEAPLRVRISMSQQNLPSTEAANASNDSQPRFSSTAHRQGESTPPFLGGTAYHRVMRQDSGNAQSRDASGAARQALPLLPTLPWESEFPRMARLRKASKDAEAWEGLMAHLSKFIMDPTAKTMLDEFDDIEYVLAELEGQYEEAGFYIHDFAPAPFSSTALTTKQLSFFLQLFFLP